MADSLMADLAGREAIQQQKTFTYAIGESKENPERLKNKFGEICKPKTNLTNGKTCFQRKSPSAG